MHSLIDSLIIFAAKYLIFVIALICALIFALAKRDQQKQLLVSGLIAVVVGFALVWLAGHIYYHPRPFVAYGIKPLVPHANDNGFPSDHTFVSALMAFWIAQISRRWGAVLFILALAVGAGRIAAHVHWPEDIAGGVGIAALAVAAGLFVTDWLKEKKKI